MVTYPPAPLCKDFIYLFQGRGRVDKRGASPLSKISSPLLLRRVKERLRLPYITNSPSLMKGGG
jgi:hypothetical protein